MPRLTPRALKKLSATLRATAIQQLGRALRLSFPRAEIFLVGGYVRDLILDRETKDIDLVVRGVPITRLEKFLRTVGKVNLVGKHFGVFKFIPRHKAIPAIDLALPRTDYAFGTGGYRDLQARFDAHLAIEDDLGRRDFTVNALAWDLLRSRLIDPFGGAKDIEQKKIRTVGRPEIRFREDYSRLLRALRFACQLNFTIEKKTWSALKKNISHLNDLRAGEFIVPRETAAKEILKSFTAAPSLALDLFDRSGVLKKLIPELLDLKGCPQPRNFHREGDVWTHTRLALGILESKKFFQEFKTTPSAELILATLFHDLGKPQTITLPKKRGQRIRFDGHDAVGAQMSQVIAERLRLSSYKDERIDVDAQRLAWLVRHHLLLISGQPQTMRATTLERYYLRDEKLGQALLALQFADGSATIDPKNRPALKEYRAVKKRLEKIKGKKKHLLQPSLLDGYAVMRITRLKPGPEVGRILAWLREAQLQGLIKTQKEAKDYLIKNKNSALNP